MKNSTLSNEQIAKFLFWADNSGKGNWGGWSNYPLSGCTFTSIEDCQIFVKFNSKQIFQGEEFTHIVSSRQYVKNGRISISSLKNLYEETNDTTLASLLNNYSSKLLSDKEEKILKDAEYRRQANTGELDEKFNSNLKKDVEFHFEQAKNRSFYTHKVGDIVSEKGTCYFGSNATAVYSKEICCFLLQMENDIKKENFTYEIVSKSNKGNTKYGEMTEESFLKFKKIFNEKRFLDTMFSFKLEQAKKFNL